MTGPAKNVRFSNIIEIIQPDTSFEIERQVTEPEPSITKAGNLPGKRSNEQLKRQNLIKQFRRPTGDLRGAIQNVLDDALMALDETDPRSAEIKKFLVSLKRGEGTDDVFEQAYKAQRLLQGSEYADNLAISVKEYLETKYAAAEKLHKEINDALMTLHSSIDDDTDLGEKISSHLTNLDSNHDPDKLVQQAIDVQELLASRGLRGNLEIALAEYLEVHGNDSNGTTGTIGNNVQSATGLPKQPTLQRPIRRHKPLPQIPSQIHASSSSKTDTRFRSSGAGLTPATLRAQLKPDSIDNSSRPPEFNRPELVKALGELFSSPALNDQDKEKLISLLQSLEQADGEADLYRKLEDAVEFVKELDEKLSGKLISDNESLEGIHHQQYPSNTASLHIRAESSDLQHESPEVGHPGAAKQQGTSSQSSHAAAIEATYSPGRPSEAVSTPATESVEIDLKMKLEAEQEHALLNRQSELQVALENTKLAVKIMSDMMKFILSMLGH